MKVQKGQEYQKYICDHKKTVKLVFGMFTQLGDLTVIEQINLSHNINVHDDSKFNKNEFYAYRKWFFLEPDDEKNSYEFDKAWLAHIAKNPHHWEYWVLPNNNAIEMERIYVLEMMCDWTAMSLKCNNLPSDWYKANREDIIVHRKTRALIEKWLPVFDNMYDKINGV